MFFYPFLCNPKMYELRIKKENIEIKQEIVIKEWEKNWKEIDGGIMQNNFSSLFKKNKNVEK